MNVKIFDHGTMYNEIADVVRIVSVRNDDDPRIHGLILKSAQTPKGDYLIPLNHRFSVTIEP